MDALRGITDNCIRAVRSIEPDRLSELVETILSSRRIFIYGSGRSGLVGQLFAVRLVQLGFDVHFVGEMTTPIITADDLTLLISNTGKTSSVVQTATIAKRIGSKVISVTSTNDCNLSAVSDITIRMDITDDEDVKRYAPLGTIFENSANLFFDCVVSEIMSREGMTEEDMRNRHAIWV